MKLSAQRSCYDKTYHVFKEGDEVFTDKVHFKAISAFKPYIVLKCYKPSGYVDSFPVMLIEVVSDKGFISKYATDRFKKTEAQLRQDKIQEVLDFNK